MIRKRTLVIELVHFEFKIRLIRLGLTSLKTKIPVYKLTTYGF